MKVVITGASGQLGQTFVRRSESLPWELFAFDRSHLDITSPSQVEQVVRESSPDVVVNCAAYTAVDKAESDRETCAAINTRAVETLARASAAVGARFVHVSTDYVFDGTASEPYTEGSPTNPINEYGRSKLAGEQLALKHNPRSLVVRTSWLYGETGHNFIRAILKRAKEKGELRVVNDQIGVPTSAEQLVNGIIELLATNEHGLFHVTNSGRCSWFDFAQEILRAVGWTHIPLSPCTTPELKLPAARPAFSVMENRRCRLLGLSAAPDWKDSFRVLLPKLLERSPELL